MCPSSRSHSVRHFHIIRISFGPDFEDRGLMRFDLTKLAFALAAYRADHGAYPATLADLSPKYVAQILKTASATATSAIRCKAAATALQHWSQRQRRRRQRTRGPQGAKHALGTISRFALQSRRGLLECESLPSPFKVMNCNRRKTSVVNCSGYHQTQHGWSPRESSIVGRKAGRIEKRWQATALQRDAITPPAGRYCNT